MARFDFLSLALLSLQALIGSGLAEDTAENADGAAQVAQLAVSAEALFPAAEIFGVKLVNGQPSQALVTFTNKESSPVTVNFIGGSLWDLDDEQSQIVRNLTTTRYSLEIPAGEKESVTYSIETEMHPQDLRLQLASIVSNSEGNYFNVNAYNSTVSVVEPETSIFDPQIIFLYFFLLACFGGVAYFFYTVWVAPYFPQKRKPAKGGEPKTSGAAKKADSDDGANVAASSATTYNAEWIPAHHISRPEQRKVKGRSTKTRV